MEIKVNDVVVLTLTDTQVQVIANASTEKEALDLIKEAALNGINDLWVKSYVYMRDTWIKSLDDMSLMVMALPEYKTAKEMKAAVAHPSENS